MAVEHLLIHAEGVFFELSEAAYHSALGLSASGIKWLRVSTLDWWARSPLNAAYQEEETDAFGYGKAMHKRILEGRAAFNDSYAAALDPTDYPGTLRTNEEIRNAILQLALPAPPKSARKEELIAAFVRSGGHPMNIWQNRVGDHAREHAGKVLLSTDLIRRIEVAAAMIERHPELSRALRDGEPEVSIFWRDEQTGIPCKARLDYLKPRLIVDLKTFSNPYGMSIDKAIARAMANYRYHVQAAWYLQAVNAAQHTPTVGSVSHTSSLLRLIDFAFEHEFLFVFQQQGVAPVARGKLFGPGLVMDIARQEIEQAKLTWLRCWETFGPDTPWIDTTRITQFDDSEFPVYIGE